MALSFNRITAAILGKLGGAAPLRFASAANYGPQTFQTVAVNVATTVDQYSRTPFVIGADTPVLPPGFFNWWLAPAAGVTNPSNSFTITQCAIEIGATAVQVFFGGSASAVMTPGSNLIADPVTAAQFSLAKFAQGTTGFIRTRITLSNPATDKLAYSGGIRSTLAGIQPRVDPTKVNMTNGVVSTGAFTYSMINGGVNGTDAVAGNPYTPFLLGAHSQPSVGFWGDSKTSGTGDTPNTIGVLGMNRALCPTAGVAAGARSGCNFGNPSGVAADCTTAVGGASLSSLTFWYQYCNYAVVGYGTNSLSQAAQTALHTQIRAAGITPIIQRSLTPRGSTTTGASITLTGATASGTTVTGTAASTAALVNGNTYTVAGATGTGAALLYNGSFVVTVVNGTTITYTATSAPAATATGTLTVQDQYRTVAGQTAQSGWSVGGGADTFEAFLRGLVSSDANLTYYQSQGERQGASGTSYWVWKCDGTTPYLYTADGLHESAAGYEANVGSAGTVTTQAGGTVSQSLRALVGTLT